MKKLGIWLWLVLILALPVEASGAQVPEAVIPVSVLTDGAPGEDSWTLELEALTPGSPMPAGSIGNRWQMSLKTTGQLRIPCGDLGVYEYILRQIPGEDPECTYDPREYRLKIFVTTEDGKTVVTVLAYDQQDAKVPQIRFRNHRAMPVGISFNALKTMDGETPADGRFSFRLLAEDGSLLYEVKNTGRHVTFPVMEFDAPGTYRFFLKEVKGDEKKILYDRTVYTVTVEVFLDGDYRAGVTYQRNGKPYSGIPTFANYTDTGSPKTGDSIDRWFTVLLVSSAGLLVMLTQRRRRKH